MGSAPFIQQRSGVLALWRGSSISWCGINSTVGALRAPKIGPFVCSGGLPGHPLRREYFLRHDIADDQTYLDRVAVELNNRPRRSRGYGANPSPSLHRASGQLNCFH
jgi:hypothetical protein